MKLAVKKESWFDTMAVYYATGIRILLNALLLVIFLGLIIGVFKAGYDIVTSLSLSLEKLLQKILLDAVFIIALVEITIIILGYLKDGRVHVRYIVDTILIVMLNEIISLWFKEPELSEMIGISVVIATLALVRITAVKFSPNLPD